MPAGSAPWFVQVNGTPEITIERRSTPLVAVNRKGSHVEVCLFSF